MAEQSVAAGSQGGERPNAAQPAAERTVATPSDVARLITEHHEAVYRYAYRLAGGAPDAEDLTQQTFLIAQQRLHQLREPEKARGWLYAVLRSVYLKSRRKPHPVPAANLELDVDKLPDPAVPAEGFDPELLQAAINGLPDEFKLVVLMFYFEDCSYKEIAEQLNLPLGTVMSRLSRAKGRLREVLSAERDSQPSAMPQVARQPAAGSTGNGFQSSFSPISQAPAR
jgi:RNA polymerase sigma-70 factor (ECF subfamily)